VSDDRARERGEFYEDGDTRTNNLRGLGLHCPDVSLRFGDLSVHHDSELTMKTHTSKVVSS